MIELLPLSIGIGLAVGMLLTELFGLASGGLIVPGYIALFLTEPLKVGLTVVVGLATFAIVRALSTFVIVYGRRRTAMMILVGYMLGMLTRTLGDGYGAGAGDIEVIGYIIPGLIALWMDRQGVATTVSALVVASVIVRLILVLTVGVELA